MSSQSTSLPIDSKPFPSCCESHFESETKCKVFSINLSEGRKPFNFLMSSALLRICGPYEVKKKIFDLKLSIKLTSVISVGQILK